MYPRILDHLNAYALQFVRSAIVISDNTIADNPIVSVNPAFETLTGYSRDECLGKNCRFLQGADRDQPGIPVIRRALAERAPAHAVLRNYRKDGSLFYNDLFIDPILGPGDVVTHFVGCQNAISDPQEAHLLQDAILRYERLTKREREVFNLISNGHSNKSAAQELNISFRTIEKHKSQIFMKLEVRELALIVRYAIALRIRIINY